MKRALRFDSGQFQLTRKVSSQREDQQVCFPGKPRANKIQIKKAIELLFKEKGGRREYLQTTRARKSANVAPISAARHTGKMPSSRWRKVRKSTLSKLWLKKFPTFNSHAALWATPAFTTLTTKKSRPVKSLTESKKKDRRSE